MKTWAHLQHRNILTASSRIRKTVLFFQRFISTAQEKAGTDLLQSSGPVHKQAVVSGKKRHLPCRDRGAHSLRVLEVLFQSVQVLDCLAEWVWKSLIPVSGPLRAKYQTADFVHCFLMLSDNQRLADELDCNGNPMRRSRSSKRGSPRRGSSRGSTPTKGIQSERSR